MEISRKSWHYRLMSIIERFMVWVLMDDWYPDRMPTNLCSYFWYFNFLVFLVLPTAVILFLCKYIVVVPVLFVARMFTKLFGIKSGLLIEYLKAKKRKVCPLIKFKD